LLDIVGEFNPYNGEKKSFVFLELLQLYNKIVIVNKIDFFFI